MSDKNVYSIKLIAQTIKNETNKSIGYILKLVKKGADVNFQKENGETALHYAIRNNNSFQISELIKNGANIDVFSNYSGLTPLCQATVIGNLKIIKQLLKLGADFDKGSRDNNSTPIIYAILDNNIEALKLLINSKADINKANKFGTPLYNAIHMDSVECFKLLLYSGAKYDSLKKQLKNNNHSLAKVFPYSVRMNYAKIIEDFEISKLVESVNLI